MKIMYSLCRCLYIQPDLWISIPGQVWEALVFRTIIGYCIGTTPYSLYCKQKYNFPNSKLFKKKERSKTSSRLVHFDGRYASVSLSLRRLIQIDLTPLLLLLQGFMALICPYVCLFEWLVWLVQIFWVMSISIYQWRLCVCVCVC